MVALASEEMFPFCAWRSAGGSLGNALAPIGQATVEISRAQCQSLGSAQEAPVAGMAGQQRTKILCTARRRIGKGQVRQNLVVIDLTGRRLKMHHGHGRCPQPIVASRDEQVDPAIVFAAVQLAFEQLESGEIITQPEQFLAIADDNIFVVQNLSGH